MKYRWNAKRRHGVHSPFVYELTDKCFRIPTDSTFQQHMKTLKSRLKGNNTQLEITDHGAGSKKLGKTRSVGSIYATNSSKGKYGKMLFQLVQHYQMQSVLELGTSLGIGSVCMATGNKSVHVTTIEGCPNIHQTAETSFQALDLSNIHAIQGTFAEEIPKLPDSKFDLIFIDGHHDGDALLQYIEQLLPHAHNDTFFVLDDIRWSTSMKTAWLQVKEDPRFHVTIDLFRMGMVLLRPQQEKEHFDIRV